jgi:hypothetical protein
MTTLEQIKEFSRNEIQLTNSTIEKIITKEPPKTLLEKIGDQALSSAIRESRGEYEGKELSYGVYSAYEQMELSSKLLRAAVCYKMALKKRTTSTKRKNPAKKKASKKPVSKKSKAKTNRSKTRS